MSVRLANANDYEEILELSRNIKDTFDYFPFRFHKWLAEPNKIAVIAEKGTEVVGFGVSSVVDDGESVSMEAGRIDPNHSNNGVLGLLRSLGFVLTREKFPKVVRTRYTVWSVAYQGVQN